MVATEKGLANEVQNARGWVVLVHLAAFATLFVPLGNVIGPLLVWLTKKSTSPAVDRHGKAALNFQISMVVYVIAFIVLLFVVGALLAVGILCAVIDFCGEGLDVVLLAGLTVFSSLAMVGAAIWCVMVVVAAARAGSGKDPGYMLSIRWFE